MSRKLALALACLLVAGLSGCSGETREPGEGAAADPCGLLNAGELEAVLSAREPEPAGRLVPTRRYVTLDQRAPTDVCDFTLVSEGHEAIERALEIHVTAGAAKESDAGHGARIDDLGDEASFSADAVSSRIDIRRDDVRLRLELASVRRRVLADPPAPLVTAARQALERLPEHASVRRLAAEGACAKVDPNAVAAGVGGRPAYSRSLASGGQDSCVFTTSRGQRAELTLFTRPDGRKATSVQRGAPTLDMTGVEAYWHLGEVWVYGTGRALSIKAPKNVPVTRAKPTLGLGRLAVAAAEAYRLRAATPSPDPAAATGPCSLLTPEQAGRLDPSMQSEREPVPLRVVSRAVWSYGAGVLVDTCGYARNRVAADERPDLEVGVAAGHYDPVADDDRFPKERQPIAGLGDRAYFVYDSDEGWLVVERGRAQLTFHSRLSYQDKAATVRAGYVRAAREALAKLPAEVEIAATLTDPECTEIGTAVAAAVGGELRYTRGVASDFAASCTYTMATGAAVQVGVERNLTDTELRKEHEHGKWFDEPGIDAGTSNLWSGQGELVKVFGNQSLVTASLHRPGERAFPSGFGADSLAVAKAVKPLLD